LRKGLGIAIWVEMSFPLWGGGEMKKTNYKEISLTKASKTQEFIHMKIGH